MNRFRFSRSVALFFCGVLHVTTTLALSPPPPPEPSPPPVIPKFDPVPSAPSLSLSLSQTRIQLSWNAVEHAEYYPVYIYTGDQWTYMGDIDNTRVEYDYQQQGWDPYTVQAKVLACKSKPWWLLWAVWEEDRCSEWSNVVTISDYLPTPEPEPDLPPTVTIDNPPNLITVGATPISINGQVSHGVISLTVNGVPITSSAGFYEADVSLSEGHNTIIARVVDYQGNVSTASISASLDLTPPTITVESPLEGTTVYSDKITVTGLVNDIVRGTIEQYQVNITANDIPGTVSNRSYSVKDIPLQLGENFITLTASDQVGNTAQKNVLIHYELPIGRQIKLIDGQDQSAQIASVLNNPLWVKVVDDTGAPVSGETVVFRVTQGSGSVAPDTDQEGRAVAVVSDANGQRRPTSVSVSA